MNKIFLALLWVSAAHATSLHLEPGSSVTYGSAALTIIDANHLVFETKDYTRVPG